MFLELKLPCEYIFQEHFCFKEIQKPSELLNLDLNEVNKLLDCSGKCICLYVKNELVGYCWYFTDTYTVKGVSTIDLEARNAIWVGPAFIAKSYRSKGYNKQLIKFVLANCTTKKHARALTSINSDNKPSINSFLNMGFKSVFYYKSSYFFGISKVKGPF